MGVVVRKSASEVVRPLEEAVTSTGHISLSPVDKIGVSFPVTMFLVFDGAIAEPAKSIKRALSKALVHYLPISGRLLAGPTPGEFRVTLTGEGVLFVAAEATSCALKDMEQQSQELAMNYPAGLCSLDDPLLMMQVTEFLCGGFVIGVTWNHCIADAAGMGQFLRAIGELARGESSPSIVPVRCWDDFLPGGITASTRSLMELMMSFQPVDMTTLDFTVPSRVINGIKEECRRVHSKPCTTFEAVTALLWQCRTRAIGVPNRVAIYFAVDSRKYVGARAGYYGNCGVLQHAVAMGDEVANGHVVDVVKMIQLAKSQIADQFGDKQVSAHSSSDVLVGYNLFTISSWLNLGLEEVDLGGGKPVEVTSYVSEGQSVPACVVCQGRDGCKVMSIFVTKEHAGDFLGEVSSTTNNK